jgi:hypothetical protein
MKRVLRPGLDHRKTLAPGAAALFILLTNYLSLMAEISASKAAVFIALFFFAIAGLSGALGRILTELKGLPGIGGG